MLPDWQQRIWVGHNISPDGGVSVELIASQVRAELADTQSPDEFLKRSLETLDRFSEEKLSYCLFRKHDLLPELFEKAYRFRAIDDSNLFVLATVLAQVSQVVVQ